MIPVSPGRSGTVALVVRSSPQFELVETLSDEREIALLEEALAQGSQDPMQVVLDFRTRQAQEDEEFGDYVENLLSRPFVRPEIMEHGIQWFRSKIRIEEFQKTEIQARQVIADFAFQVYQEDPQRTDFVLAGPTAKVRVRVFVLSKAQIAPRVA